jgi:hypothetical protein
MPGETYAEAAEDVRGKLASYRSERPKEALALELAGGLTTGVAGGARALAATAGRSGARELAKTLARKATTSSIAQGVIGGAAGAEGGVENRARGALIGGTVGAVLPFAASQVAARLPVSKQVIEGAGRGYTAAQRGAANLLEGTPLQRFGRALEPTDALRIQRTAGETLPGGVTGPTITSMEGGAVSARTATEQARIAAQQGRLTAQQAAAARTQAQREAQDAMRQVRGEEAALGSLTAQRAAAVREMGAGRAERLTATAQEAKAAAKATRQAGTQASREAERALREEAKSAAERELVAAQEEAAQAIGALRGRQPRGAAKRAQETIRRKQLAEGQRHYEVVEQFGAPPDPDPEVYREIFANPGLSGAYQDALGAIRKEARNAVPGAPVRQSPLRIVSVGGVETPEITLEVMDEMRRRVMAPQMRKGPDTVGLSRSQKREALDTINRLEERYLAGFGSDEAAEALRTARGAYRQKFQVLEALQDGLNLGTVKAGKASGLLTQSRKELDEVVERVAQMSPKEQTAFQVGAREWFDRLAQEAPDDALALARKFRSEASQRRLALAYGDEAVETLRAFTPTAVGARQQQAAAAAREEGQQLARDLVTRAEQAAAPLESRAARAARLAQEAKAAKAGRAEQLVGRREAEATQRIAATRRTAGESVREARARARTTSDEAGQLAEALSRARIAETQARGLPLGDLGKALGSSTQQQTFVQRLLPQLSPAQRAQATEVLGSNLQREIQDMARRGATPDQIRQRVAELQQNDAVQALFSGQMAQFGRRLSPTIGTRIPRAIRPTVTGALSRRIGSNYNDE